MTNTRTAVEVQPARFPQQQRQGIRLPSGPEEAGIRASTGLLYFGDSVLPLDPAADHLFMVIRLSPAQTNPTVHYPMVGQDLAVRGRPHDTHDEQESVSRVRDERISEVEQLLVVASSDDWDGKGSMPLSESTVGNAVAFLRACPDEAFLGEIDYAADATGDGDVMLTWAVGFEHLLTVLMTSDCQVLHSAVCPTTEKERKGVTDWVETDQLPEGIRPCFDRLTAAIS